MKMSNRINTMLALGATSLLALVGCTEALQPLELEYKEDPNFAPPHIQAEWNLEEVADGLAGDGVYAYRDLKYNQLFTRTLGWNGGDGVLTVGLPDGHVLWTFNDSFYGVVDGETRARRNCSFPRNSIMVQSAENGLPGDRADNLIWLADFVQTENPDAPGYYKALTHVDHPKASSYNDDGIAQDYLYWSGDGSVVDGKLQLIWMGVHTPGDGQMINQNAALATYSLSGKPGDAGYLKLESINHDWIPENPYGYGSTLWEDEDGHFYLYSTTGTGQLFTNVPIVARTKSADLNSGLEYYVPDENGELTWQDGYPSLIQAQNSGIAPGEGAYSMPWVFKKDGTYYMVAQGYPFGHDLYIMRSEHPWGPFTDHKKLLSFPNPLDVLQQDPSGNEYQNLYMLNLHPSLSRDGELVISTNTDIDDFWRNFNNPGSADWYRPFFYRIFKWERVFGY